MGFYALSLPFLIAAANDSRLLGELEPRDAQHRRIPAKAYLPTYRFLLDQMNGGYDPRPDIVAFIQEVLPHWRPLKDDPAFLARIDALTDRDHEMRAAEGRGDIKPVPKGFHEFSNRDFKLTLQQSVPGHNRSVSVRDLVQTVTAAGDPLLAEVCTSNRAMLGVIHALRTFDDTCIRYVAARQVASDTGTPLARVLALYREEGNLCVYPSMSSMLRGIPSGVLTDGSSGAWNDARIRQVDDHVEPTLIHLTLRPNMTHLVWLADDTAAPVQALDVPTQKDDHVKSLALASGFLAQTIGCDLLAGRAVGRERNALTFVTSEFLHVSTGYWRATKPDTTEADAGERWRSMLANLELSRRSRIDAQLGPQAVIVAPTNPVKHIVGVLTEGVRLLRYFDFLQTLLFKDASTTSLPGSPRVPIAIAYLRYNQQHNQDDSGTAGYILATLLRVHSYVNEDSAPPSAKPLFRAISSAPDFPGFLETTAKDIATKISAVTKSQIEAAKRLRLKTGRNTDIESPAAGIHRDAAVAQTSDSPHGERMKPALHRFMTTPGNPEILWEYIQTVSEGDWSSWTASRQNATSHRRLHDFYHLVFE